MKISRLLFSTLLAGAFTVSCSIAKQAADNLKGGADKSENADPQKLQDGHGQNHKGKSGEDDVSSSKDGQVPSKDGDVPGKGGDEPVQKDPGQNEPGQSDKDPSQSGKVVRTGYDMKGNSRSCTKMPDDMACTEVFMPGDQYALDCKAAGGEAFQCGCHDFICSKRITADSGGTHTGFDMKGNQTSCKIPSKDMMCDMSFGPGDQYGMDCKNAGGTAYFCGCHSYLCSKKIN